MYFFETFINIWYVYVIFHFISHFNYFFIFCVGFLLYNLTKVALALQHTVTSYITPKLRRKKYQGFPFPRFFKGQTAQSIQLKVS